ncbi:hypothetical protein ACIPUP_17595 [Pectobacterium actinidiae]|uniref:Uncharacterized protein n=1 Tax=Pectobacterium actinidiae TaxID=1507808 RepID=A0ABW8GE61_9GAMM
MLSPCASTCPVQPECLLAPVTVADARQTVQHIVLVAGNELAQAGFTATGWC